MLTLSVLALSTFVPSGSAVPKFDVRTELYVDGAWVDISADVRADPPISCARGRRDERSHVTAGRCSLTLDNSAGDYSNRLPTSAYYGKIGRNTPVRVSLATPAHDVGDTFSRSATNSWGSADSGQAYTLLTAGGGSAADFDVTGGEGTIVVGSANSYRLAYLPDVHAVDGDALLGPVNLPAIASPAGGSLEPVNIAVRMRSSTDYYLFRVEWTTSNAVVAKVYAPGVADPLATATVFTSSQWTPAEDLMVRVQWEGEALRMRVWQADQSEPSTWNLETYDGTYLGPGWVGLRAGAASGNSNVPVTFGYGAFTVSSKALLFTGEISEWPQRWNVKGSDVTAPVEAAGIMRRLTQGAKALRSPLFRKLSSLDLLDYWSFEEPQGDVTVLPSSVGGSPLQVVHGESRTRWAEDSSLAGSAPLPSTTLGGAVGAANYRGAALAAPATDDAWSFLMWAYTGLKDDATTTNTLSFEIRMANSPQIGAWFGTFRFDNFGVTPRVVVNVFATDPSGAVAAAVSMASSEVETYTDLWRMLRATVDLSGGSHRLRVYLDETLLTTVTSGGVTVGQPRDVRTITAQVTNSAVPSSYGHFAIASGSGTDAIASNAQAIYEAGLGHAGETATARIVRLCGEEGIPVAVDASADPGPALGPQRPVQLLDLLRGAADAGQGVLAEMRGAVGLRYRSVDSLYNQASVQLAYTGATIGPGLAPTDDDQHVHNDVTTKRPDGGTARYEVTTGPLSTQDPPDGVGVYDRGAVEVNVEADSQLLDVAGWVAHLGTWDEPRWPSVPVLLAAPAVLADDELTADLLALDTGDLLTITGPPAWLPPDDIATMVQATRAELDQSVPAIAFTTTPAGPYTVAVLDSDTLGKLDTAGAELASGVDDDDTSLSVATTSGALWTVDAAEVPFDVRVGGERVTVTAVAGASSPQTFTVTRSVNGVVKAHDAGAVVSLWTPARAAL